MQDVRSVGGLLDVVEESASLMPVADSIVGREFQGEAVTGIEFVTGQETIAVPVQFPPLDALADVAAGIFGARGSCAREAATRTAAAAGNPGCVYRAVSCAEEIRT
jgi:hypothetical protein